MSDLVHREIEAIYGRFNELFFGNELSIPMFSFKDIQHSVLSSKIKVQSKKDYHPMASLPLSSLYMDISYLCSEILNVMIIQYSEENGIKVASNRNIYHNRRYKEFVNRLGFNCDNNVYRTENDCGYGYTIKVDDTFKDFCASNGFHKTWTNVYLLQNYKLNQTWNTNLDSKSISKAKAPSSTRKYVDANGESVRATREHILFCLDGHPDIADEIEARYGIKRMTTDYVPLV